jgi:hypothetical protein
MRDASPDIKIANYAVCFIDLLGQKKAMVGQAILPSDGTPEQNDALIRLIKETVGKISAIHDDAEAFLASLSQHGEPPEPLSGEDLQSWNELHAENRTTQRWSDGLVVFTCLGGTTLVEQINGIYAQFCLAGMMCLLGLAREAPLRGGIDIAWGVELHPGELYGPALANAYVLESECARFPRIVVGEHVRNYLVAASRNEGGDVPSKASRQFASICLGMLSRDRDGLLFLDYLSDAFERSVTSSQIDMLWARGREFMENQVEKHASSGDETLRYRYLELAEYFESRPPPSMRKE